MRSRLAVAAALVTAMTAGGVSAQEARPGGSPPGPVAPGQHGHTSEGHGHHHDGHLMMCHHVPPGAPGMSGPGLVPGLADLPADPRHAARVLRFRADMLKAISEVLARHAAKLEKGQ